MALVLAVAVGVAVGYVAFNDDDSANERFERAADDHVTYACHMTERLGQTHTSPDDLGGIGEDPWFYEVIAVGSLVSAAAHEPAYEHLAEFGTKAQTAVNRVDFNQWTEFVDKFLAEC